MTWMLQPKNYNQILRPNLYNVHYGRVGTYKGMGRLQSQKAHAGRYGAIGGQGLLWPPGLRGLGQDSSSGPTLSQLWNLPYTTGYTVGQPGEPLAAEGLTTPLPFTATVQAPGIGTWLAQNGTYVALGVGVFALLMATGGRRR